MKNQKVKNISTIRKKFNTFIFNTNTVGYIFSAPFIIGFLCFSVIPMVISFYYSFTDYSITTKENWVGLTNYITLFYDERFINSLLRTLEYVFISVPLKLIFALFIAFMLTKKSKAVSFYRSLYYLPSLIGGSVAVALVWKELFSRKGLINTNLESIGIPTVNWFGSMNAAIWPLVFMTIWQFGSSMLIFAAGLKEIPRSYYESAQIDGANGVQSFSKITLPCLSPVILFNLVMQLISGFMAFTQAFVITGGGPNDATMFYALYMYKQAFTLRNMGYASAMSWAMLLVMGIITFVVFKTSKHWVFYEAGDE